MADEVVRISFIGDANFADVSKRAKLLQAQFEAIKASQMDISTDKAWRTLNVNIGRSTKLTQLYETAVTSSADRLSESIEKGTLTFRQAIAQRKVFNNVIKQQIALQKSLATVTEDANGVKRLQMWGVSADQLSNKAITLRSRMGTISTAMKSVGDNMIKSGKNMQWAGRQMMVGLGVPIAALGLATGKLAKETDEQFTRIAKVYGDSTTAISVDLAKLRAEGTKTYEQASKLYGMSAKDTLGLQADLAAAGRTGEALQKQTLLVARAMTLGEADQATAMKGVIALQSVYHMNTRQIADALNYMNSVENATNLSFQDFITAIPRGAGILAKMGVTLQDLGPLLVAVKQSGIDAAQGMRGIASGAQSLLKIAPQTEKLYQELTGKSLSETVIEKQGKFVDILNAMSDAMAKLKPYQQQQLITQIFGKFQSAKMVSVFDAFINKTNQVSSAMDVSRQSTTQWADTANRELTTFQKSISGRWKIAVTELENSLMPMGYMFLKIATGAADFFTKLAKAFNAMPSWIKWVAAFGAGFVALIGALTMVGGVIGNLLGHANNLVAFIMGKWSRGQTFMTKEQRAIQLQLEQTTDGILKQTGAIQSQADALELVNKAMQDYLVSLGQTKDAAGLGMLSPNSRKINNMVATGGAYIPRHAKGGYAIDTGMPQTAKDAEHIDSELEQSEARSKRVRTNMLGVAGAVAQFGMGALAIKNMQDGSQSLLDKFVNISLLVGSVGPLLAAGLRRVKWSVVTDGIAGALKSSRITTGAATVASRVGMAMKGGIMAAMSSPYTAVIAAALAAVAVGVYAIYKHQQHVLNEQSEINDKAREWARTLGGTEKSVVNIATGMHKTKEDMQATDFASMVQGIAKANSQLVDNIGKMANGSKDLHNALANFAVTQAQMGLGNSTVQKELRALLQASGRSPVEQQRVLVHLSKVDFDNPKQVSKLFWDSFNAATKTLHPGFAGEFTSQDYSTMKAQGEQMGRAYAESDEATRKQIISRMVDWENNYQQQAFQKFSAQYKKQFQELGITSANQLNAHTLGELGMKGVPRDALESWKATQGVIDGVTTGFKNQLAVAGLDREQIKKLSDVNKVLYGITMSLAQAQEAYNGRLAGAASDHQTLSDSQKLLILNQYRMAAGLQKTTHLEDGFGKVTRDATSAVDDQTAAQKKAITTATDFSSAIGEINSAMRNQITSAQMASDLVDAYKTAMSNAQDTMLQAADDALTAQENREKNSLERRQKLEQNQLDREQKAQQEALANENRAMTNRFDQRAQILKDQATKEKRILDAQHKAELDALQKQQDAQDKALENQQNAETKRLTEQQNVRRRAVSQEYNSRINAIQHEINVEQHADDVRQAIFEAEQARVQRAAQTQNTNIDFNVAVDTGQLDEAAKIMNDSQAQQVQWANQDTNDAATTASEKRIQQLQREINQYKKLRDEKLKDMDTIDKAEKKRLEDQQKREKKALDDRQRYEKDALKKRQTLEDQNEADRERKLEEALNADRRRWTKYYNSAKDNLDKTQRSQKNELDAEQKQQDNALDNMQKNRSKHIDAEINVIKGSIPRTKRQFEQQEQTVLGVYDDYGVKIERKGSNWSQTIADGLNDAIHQAAIDIQNDQQWTTFSKHILKQATNGIGMSVGQFMKFAQTGQLPKAWRMPKPHHDTTGSRHATPDIPGSGTYHGGGEIGAGMGSGRGGIGGPIRPNERMILAKDKEFMINDRSARAIGYDKLHYMNKTGELPIGGATDIGTGGLAALPTMMMGAMIAQGINQGVTKTFDRRVQAQYDVATGRYGSSGIRLDAERAANAGAVISAGKKVGATNRDIIIGLMTALQESGLHNYTVALDHDSLGIFQQRASWGTAAQRTDPMWAATEFFKHLLKVRDRDEMSLGEAAQAVQISAYPGAYAKWEDEAREIFSVAQLTSVGGEAGQKPGDYERERFRGVTLDRRTIRMILAAEALGWPGGEMTLYQGSFSNSVAASAGTHSGGGAMDVSIDGMTQREQDRAVEILRKVGFAAWERHPWEGFTPHIHAIAIGDKLMSAAAEQQVEAFRAGRDGLADNGPDTWPDVHGGWGAGMPGREGVHTVQSGSFAPTKGVWKKIHLGHPGSMTKRPNESLLPSEFHKIKLGRPGEATHPVPNSFGVSRKWSEHENKPRATDIAAREGSPVRAVSPGLVTKSADMRGFNPLNDTPYKSYGKYVVVDHGNGMQTLYAHLSERDVRAGDLIHKGALLGKVGHTGNATGSHLHLETWWNGQSVAPGKLGIPGLNVGGEIKYDNTLANLHKNETVLTAPLSAKLESGIEKLDSGATNHYDVKVTFTGPVNSTVDVQRGVEDALQTIERRKGSDRVIRGG